MDNFLCHQISCVAVLGVARGGTFSRCGECHLAWDRLHLLAWSQLRPQGGGHQGDCIPHLVTTRTTAHHCQQSPVLGGRGALDETDLTELIEKTGLTEQTEQTKGR